MSDAEIYRYEGRQATVTWNSARCMHAGECTRGLPAVFSSKHDPWAQPDNASLEGLAAIVDRCPSGALVLERPIEFRRPADATNSVSVVANGPLNVRGRIHVGGTPVEHRVALCRCGASQSKPYCDCSHVKARFRHDGTLGANEDALADARPEHGANLSIEPTANGPLHCTGSMAIVGTDGSRAVVGETWLCRCGGSSNKPYCDGTHRRIGFVG